MKMPSRIKNCRVMITHLFDRYGHKRRTFFEKIAFFSIVQGKEIIIFVDKVVCF